MQKPLAAPALSFAAGIAASRLAPFSPAEAAVCTAAFALLAGLCYRRGSGRPGRVCAWLACCAAGLWNAAARGADPVPPPQPGDGRLTGCVVEPSTVRNDRFQFTLALDSGGRARVTVPPARGGGLPPPLAYGTRVEADLRLRPIRGFRNPGAFDVEQYQARRGVFWNAVAPRGAVPRVLAGVCGESWRRPIERWRAAALERIDRLYPGDGYHAGMLRGLLLGDKSGIRQSWTDAYRRTGTYHALVISGSHVTLVCGLFLVWRRHWGFGERTLLLLAGATAWLYALMAGADPPVLRAAAGFLLYIAACLLYRRTSILNALAAVALAFLAVDPGQLFDASFQLSFLAVAALGAFSPEPGSGRVPDRQAMALRLELKLAMETAALASGVPARWLKRIGAAAGAPVREAWALLRVSAGVQAGLALPMVLLFHRVSFTGLAANLVVVPVISSAIPFGFAAVFTGWPWAARTAAWLLDFASGAAAWCVRFEPALRIPDPPAWLAVVIPCAFLAWAAARTLRWKLVWAAACAALLAALVWYPFAPRTPRNSLELSALDVGQGESLALTLPDGSLAVVDGGGLPQYGRRTAGGFDVGEEVVSPCLWARGVRQLGAVAVTHLHDDHAGGIRAVLDNFRPRELWSGFAPDHPAWRQLSERARELGIRVRILKQGDEFDFGGAHWQALAPARGQSWTGRPRNGDSLVLRVRHGRHAFLLTGDIERSGEARLLEEGLAGGAQVLKVAHHGSRLSSLEPLLDRLSPAVAVISAGAGNSYGLPNAQVVEALRARHALVLRTDQDGLVTVRSDGRYLTVEPSRPGPTEWLRWDLF